ncbi:MAG: hypothetical protein ACI97K_002714 [Glaciecola sp.]|jgi:hypothetical protein
MNVIKKFTIILAIVSNSIIASFAHAAVILSFSPSSQVSETGE